MSGACMIVRRSVIAEVGGFDPGYFMYSEELDLCRRIKDDPRLKHLPLVSSLSKRPALSLSVVSTGRRS